MVSGGSIGQMDRRCALIFVMLLCLSPLAHRAMAGSSGYEITAVYGSTPTIDGEVSAGEWIDAASIYFNDAEVYVKQDGASLYIGFNVSDSTYSQLDSATIYIDPENHSDTILQPDDFGCIAYRNGFIAETDATTGNWTLTTVSAWTARVSTSASLWQAELNITYAKVNVTAGIEKTLGTAFERSDRGTYPSTWPSGVNLQSPVTWGAIVSEGYDWIPESQLANITPLFALTLVAAVMMRKRRKNSAIRRFGEHPMSFSPLS